jgi:hypothetical protein
MKPTGREVIDILEKVVRLEWFRYARAEVDCATTTAPITVWRFSSTDTSEGRADRVVRALRSVLDGFSGNVPWSLKLSGSNWVLLPTQVQQLEDGGNFRTDGEILEHLRTKEPALGRRAHEDLAAIAAELARLLQVGE